MLTNELIKEGKNKKYFMEHRCSESSSLPKKYEQCKLLAANGTTEIKGEICKEKSQTRAKKQYEGAM